MADIKWTTKEGKKIPISEMTNSHLQNCIKLLTRRMEEIQKANRSTWGFAACLQGEQAGYAMDAEIRNLEEQEENIFNARETLQKELDKRNV